MTFTSPRKRPITAPEFVRLSRGAAVLLLAFAAGCQGLTQDPQAEKTRFELTGEMPAVRRVLHAYAPGDARIDTPRIRDFPEGPGLLLSVVRAEDPNAAREDVLLWPRWTLVPCPLAMPEHAGSFRATGSTRRYEVYRAGPAVLLTDESLLRALRELDAPPLRPVTPPPVLRPIRRPLRR